MITNPSDELSVLYPLSEIIGDGMDEDHLPRLTHVIIKMR